MLKFDIRPEFECQNRILNVKIRYSGHSNVKIGFRMSKFDIRSQFEFQNRILNVKIDIRPEFECQNRILNVKIRYSVQVRMSK